MNLYSVRIMNSYKHNKKYIDSMSAPEVTRWQHNHIYPQSAKTNNSLRIHKRFDLPFSNFYIYSVYTEQKLCGSRSG